MSTKEFAVEGLKKLHELKAEEHAIKESIKIKEEESQKKVTEIYSEYHKKGAEIYDFISKHEIFKKGETEIDIGSYHDHWVKAEELSLFGQSIATRYNGTQTFSNLPFVATSKEALKGRYLSEKKRKKYEIEENLRNEIHSIDKRIKELDKKDIELDKKIEKTVKRKPAFLFKNKLEQLKVEKESVVKEKNELTEKREELKEQLQAYEDLHVFVSDAEVNKDFELFTKVQKLIEDYREFRKQIDQRSSEARYKADKENEQLANNRASQTKVLEALLTPELLDEIEAYVASPEADEELVEVATKVLKAGGRGPKKVTI